MALRRNRVPALVGTACLITVGLFAAPAQAAEGNALAEVHSGAGISDFFIYYGGDQRNQVEVTLTRNADESKYFYVVDDVVEIEAGAQCTHPDAADLTKVSCTVNKTSTGNVQGNVFLEGGDDSATYGGGFYGVFTKILLGSGNDTYLTGDPRGYEADVSGEDGNDTITAGWARVIGGNGDDVISLVGSLGTADGGAGVDEINGSAGADELLGGAGSDTIRGNAGNDTISGGNDNDTITGGTGDDTITGGTGDDTIYGNSGNDTIYGNSGDDYLSGGPGTDTISGGAGTNTIIN